MSILVFGKTGQLARELALLDGVTCLGRAQVDLSDPAACAEAIGHYAPVAVINAAAYTAVDRAEEEDALAQVVNGAAPAAMAQACAELDIPFVTVSTDYVFDGSGTIPWQPSDAVAPINAYGRSKLAGKRRWRLPAGAMPFCAPPGWFRPMAITLSKPCCAWGGAGSSEYCRGPDRRTHSGARHCRRLPGDGAAIAGGPG